jgi:hypothetical protein
MVEECLLGKRTGCAAEDFVVEVHCSPDDGVTGSGLRSKIFGMEFRLEPRRQVELIVSLKGQDKTGESFTQEAVASSISVCGALLSGIGREMRSGDLIWLDYAGRQARFKVVWVRDSESHQLTQAAVQLCQGEKSPWKDKVGSH